MQNGFGGDSIITTRSRGFSEIKLNGSEIGPNGSAPATPEKRATNSDQTPGNEDHDENDEVLSDHLWNVFLDLPIVRMMTEFFLNLYLSSERNAIIVFVFTIFIPCLIDRNCLRGKPGVAVVTYVIKKSSVGQRRK